MLNGRPAIGSFLTMRGVGTGKAVQDFFSPFPPNSIFLQKAAAELSRQLNLYRRGKGLPEVMVEVREARGIPSGNPLTWPLYLLGLRLPWDTR